MLQKRKDGQLRISWFCLNRPGPKPEVAENRSMTGNGQWEWLEDVDFLDKMIRDDMRCPENNKEKSLEHRSMYGFRRVFLHLPLEHCWSTLHGSIRMEWICSTMGSIETTLMHFWSCRKSEALWLDSQVELPSGCEELLDIWLDIWLDIYGYLGLDLKWSEYDVLFDVVRWCSININGSM